MNSDFKELLSIFNARRVNYLVVGGYAFMEYAEPRYTKDLDVWVGIDSANAQVVMEALQEFGAPLAGMTIADFATPNLVYQMGVPPVRVDILMSIEGITFQEAWERRVHSQFDGVPMYVISKKDLIANKTAVGRPQDLVDVQTLSLTMKDEAAEESAE